MQTPVNQNASKEAKELLSFLCKTAGNTIITGQHTQTIPMEEIQYIKQITGFTPKLRGFELLSYSPNINYADSSEDCLTEVEKRRKCSGSRLPLSFMSLDYMISMSIL